MGRIYVTGAAGFIGTNLMRELDKRGAGPLIAVDQAEPGDKAVNLTVQNFEQYLDLDSFRDLIRRGELAEDTEAILHMGACSSTTETDLDYLRDNNFLYTKELANACLERNIRFIYASSAATYGDGSLGFSDDLDLVPRLEPLNPYGQSKQDFDLHALREGIFEHIVGLKYFNVYGPREDHKGEMRSVVHKAHGQILEEGRLGLFRSYRPEYGDGEQKRDFIYVKDAVDMTLFFLDHPEIGGLFNCGSGKARSWLDLSHAVFAAMGRDPKIDFIEMPEEIRERYQYFTEADMGKLQGAGYKKTLFSLEEGILDYVRGYLARD